MTLDWIFDIFEWIIGIIIFISAFIYTVLGGIGYLINKKRGGRQ